MNNRLLILGTVLVLFTGVSQAHPDSLWFQTYGWDDVDWCETAVAHDNGDITLVGYGCNVAGDGLDYQLLRVSSGSELLWTARPPSERHEQIYDAKVLSNGAYILSGLTYHQSGDSTVWLGTLIKADERGRRIWQRYYGAAPFAMFNEVYLLEDGGILAAGVIGEAFWPNPWIVRTDSVGEVVSSLVVDDIELRQWITLLDYDLESSVIFAGGEYVAAYNWEGERKWRRNLGFEVRCNTKLDDRIFFLGGESDNGFGIASIDTSGILRLRRNLDFEIESPWRDYDARCHTIYMINNNHILMGGWAKNDLHQEAFCIAQVEPDGFLEWSYVWLGQTSNAVHAIIPLENNIVLLAGQTDTPNNRKDYFIYAVDLAPNGIKNDEIHELTPSFFSLSAPYPNPFNSTVKLICTVPQMSQVLIKLYNPTGKFAAVVANDYFLSGQHSVTWDASTMPPGIYFATMEANGFSQTVKLMLLK